jgi:hypothetical protein
MFLSLFSREKCIDKNESPCRLSALWQEYSDLQRVEYGEMLFASSFPRYEQMTITANAVMVNCHSGYINWETI